MEQLTSVENVTANSGTASYNIWLLSKIYLATAIVDVVDSQGNYQPCRVMIYGGSQLCSIFDSCASHLGLRKRSLEIPLFSIDGMCTKIQFRTSATIKSRFDNKCCKSRTLNSQANFKYNAFLFFRQGYTQNSSKHISDRSRFPRYSTNRHNYWCRIRL